MAASETSASGEETISVRHLRLRLEQRLFGHTEAVMVGRYALGLLIGTGGMGAVYEAIDPGLERKLAIKVLHPRYADNPNAGARLVREAKALARLSHPNVVTVHEVGVAEGQPFVAMELMPGGTLAEWVQKHPASDPSRAPVLMRMLRQCAEGLLAAHDAGLVHRDFKPHNVLLAADGTAKVADFGLVLLSLDGDDGASNDGGLERIPDRRPLTAAGAIPGTVRYMPPEQQRGLVDARSDQYALCKTFAEAFGDGPMSRGLAKILRRGTRDDPDERYPDLRALLAEVDAVTRPRRGAALGIAFTGIGAIAAISWSRLAAEPSPGPPIPCDDGRSTLESAWGQARQSEVRAAFERSGETTWRRAWDGVRTRLDAYVDTWSAARLDACEATRIRRVQDERMMAMRLACLDQRRDALVVLSDAYAEADPAVVEDALTTAHALPSIESCADRKELEHGGDLGLDDPRLRAAYDAVGHADALRNLDRHAEATAAYEAVVPELEALGAEALLAKVHRFRALLANEEGDYERGEALARRSLRHAELSDRDAEIAQAWLRMSSTARLRSHYDDAELYLERAESIAARRPEAEGLHFEIAMARAHYEGARGNTEPTLAALERAGALADEVDASPSARLQIRQLKLQLLVLLGRDDEAVTYGEQLLEDARETFGPDHMETLGIAGAHADVFVHRHQWDKVVALTEPSVRRPMRKARADRLMSIRSAYLEALDALGETDTARRVLEDTLAEATPLLGADHHEVILARMQLGVFLSQEKRYAEAVEHLLPIADIAGREVEGDAGGAMHPLNRHAFWGNLGVAQCNAGQHAAAVESIDLAERIVRAASDPGSIWVFRSMVMAGQVYEECGEPERARSRYAEALELSKSLEAAPDDLAILERGLKRLRQGAPSTRD